ncbi:hypothetical protein SAY87_027890 [Trapa incisa]|uniref:Tify domain-containing protein n=1 Tax=Trapa incisa TaxID=236973 RepID=A0AAN7KTQ9_9MYRT|nr:hypothetical protein SAY87_027890 [Trapa incisa]
MVNGHSSPNKGGIGEKRAKQQSDPTQDTVILIIFLQVMFDMPRRSSRQPAGTPIKKLLEKEMSQETESRRRSQSVIARLMGLDVPAPLQLARRSEKRYSDEPSVIAKVELVDRISPFSSCRSSRRSSKDDQEFKDIFEVVEVSKKAEKTRFRPHQTARSNITSDEMAFIRQKFMEAKQLSTDDKLHNSKEFRDAIEVLDSNSDLLLRFLQRPDSLFRKHLNDLDGAAFQSHCNQSIRTNTQILRCCCPASLASTKLRSLIHSELSAPTMAGHMTVQVLSSPIGTQLETKRSHQWLMDDPRIDLLPNRKQAVGLRNNHSFLESLNSSPSQWGIASGFHTSLGHFGEQSFDLESWGVNNYDGRDIGVGDDRIITLGITSGGDGSGVSTGTLHGIENESASIGPTYEEDGDNVSVSQVMGKEHHCILSSGQGHQTDSCTMSMSQLYNQEGNNSSVSVSNSYDKIKNVESHKIVHIPNAIESVGLVKSNDGGRIAVPGAGDNSKKGELHMTEKIPSNNFPSNIRSLLSTGILDGVHVKYIAWSQEKDLPGIIRGCGYLCGCSSCNHSKVINAYEFERRAGCKTKHPNNHIYFENGKIIYGTVQELRSTPQHTLLEVTQTITGWPINQKSFRLWKESYMIATQELQGIYRRDDGRFLLCSVFGDS